MRLIPTIIAALALVQSGAGLVQKPRPKAAPPAAKPAAPAGLPTAAEMKDATDTLSLLVSAFNSKDVPAETKDGLLLCLYGNPLGKIAKGQAEALAADKTIDSKSPTQRLFVIAALCGAPIPKPADGKAELPAPAKEP